MTSPMVSSKKAPFFFFQPKVNVNTEIDKLVERLGILPELDMTRLRLVVYEMVLHRQWISPSIRLFAGGTVLMTIWICDSRFLAELFYF